MNHRPPLTKPFTGPVALRCLACMTLFVALASLPSLAGPVAGPYLDAVTFAADPGKIFVPLNPAIRELRWPARHDEKNDALLLKKTSLPTSSLRSLLDGTTLISIHSLQAAGAPIITNPDTNVITVGKGFRRFHLKVREKRVEISLANQQLRAWQGERLVLQTNISSGRYGSTPSGNFKAGPYKARMHYSKLYDNAPMPWSVQIYGHVFIHGYTHVPNYPASHGCIRVPLTKGNPARFFYDWIDLGTPVRVLRN